VDIVENDVLARRANQVRHSFRDSAIVHNYHRHSTRTVSALVGGFKINGGKARYPSRYTTAYTPDSLTYSG
jgi:hypothetical protein